jgi:four helix bundle protein
MSDHRQLRVWATADVLVRQVHPIVMAFRPADRWTLGSQLWRAALSIPCNIVEGYARSSPKQLLYHLNVALGSLAETTYLLELASVLEIAVPGVTAGALATARDLKPPLLTYVARVREGRSRHSRFRQPAAALAAPRPGGRVGA